MAKLAILATTHCDKNGIATIARNATIVVRYKYVQ